MRALALLALASLPAFAEESRPMRWWVVGAASYDHEAGGSIELRTVEQARKALARKTKDGIEVDPLADRVDFEKWMLVIVECTGNGGTKWEVVSAAWERKEPTITLVTETNPDGNEAWACAAIVVLIPRCEGKVTICRTAGEVAEARRGRDCSCGPRTMMARSEGKCRDCGRQSEIGQPGSCGECAARRQVCQDCDKRVPGPAPLKEEK